MVGEDGTAMGAGGGLSHGVPVRKQRAVGVMLSSLCPLTGLHIPGQPLLLISRFPGNTPQTCPELCFHGDSKCSQVVSADH